MGPWWGRWQRHWAKTGRKEKGRGGHTPAVHRMAPTESGPVQRLRPQTAQEDRDLTGKGKTCLIVRMRESGEMAEVFAGYDAGGISDTAAVERTLAGEREAFSVLVERHSAYVYRVAYRMTGNSQDAEEVVQEAFLRAFQKLRQFAGNANFGTWVYRIAANYAIDRLRQKKNEEARREVPLRTAEGESGVDGLSRIKDGATNPERLAG